MECPIIDFATADLEDRREDVVFRKVHDTEYGTKVHIDSPDGARDVIRDLDRDATHRAWDDEATMWTVDLGGVGHAPHVLREGGFSLAATEEVGRPLEE